MSRLIVLEKLIKAEGDLVQLEKQLDAHGWDFDGVPLVLDRGAVRSVLERFVQGQLSLDDVYLWAETLEMREDVDYQESEEELLSQIIHQLANPFLEGELTVDVAQKLLMELKRL